MIATATLIVAALLLVGWLTWITTRVQQLTDRLEPAADALERLLPAVPGKSAPRTGERFLGVPMTADRPSPTPRTDAGLDLLDSPARRRHAAPRTNRKETA